MIAASLLLKAGRPLPAHLQTLRLKVLALLVSASLGPLAIVGGGAWVVFSKIIARKTDQHLQTVASDHGAAIDLFLNERLMALELVARVHSRQQLSRMEELHEVFRHLNVSYADSFQDLGVIDETGRHLAYVGPYNLLDHNYQATEWFKHVQREGHYVSDVFLGFRGVPHFILAVRRDEPADGFWILRASVNSEKFGRLVASGRMGRTGDCFIIDRLGRYQTPPKDGASVLDPSGITLPGWDPAAPSAVQTVVAVGPSGRKITRTLKPIKQGQWVMVAQQDQDEANAPVRTAMVGGLIIWVVGVAVIVLTSFGATRFVFRLIARTQRQKEMLDSQLFQASKLATVGEMATGVAHEINNPLAIIYTEQTNISDLLAEIERDAGPDVQKDGRLGEIKASVGQSKKQIERCKAITQKMLQFGQRSSAAGTRIDLRRELTGLVSLLRYQAKVNNVELCLEVPNSLPLLPFDPGEFQQVITNLVNNAIHAINQARPREQGGVLISAWAEGGSLFLEIEDTGPGIPPEIIGRIFEPFFTTKPIGKGTGLGLSVCYGIITRWRGLIQAESHEGAGACFRIQFPTSEAQESPRVTEPPGPHDIAPPGRLATLQRCLRSLPRRSRRRGMLSGVRRVRFHYRRFREILLHNDAVLWMIADVEEKISGRVPFALGPLAERIRSGLLDAFVMAKNLSQLGEGRFSALYDTLQRLGADIQSGLCEAENPEAGQGGPTVLWIGEDGALPSSLAGSKMSMLDSIRRLGLNVPDGFVVSTSAFRELLHARGIEGLAADLEGRYETHGWEALKAASQEVRESIVEGSLPSSLSTSVFAAHDALERRHPGSRLAVRSSAVAEDGKASHAGQYRSVLDVARENLLEAYLQVVASAFAPEAVAYRYRNGLGYPDAAMAVGCMRMMRPRASGILFSRDFTDPSQDRVRISAVLGLGDAIAAGLQNAEEIVVVPGQEERVASCLLGPEDLAKLVEAARFLEGHLGQPQDVEWALDRDGLLFVLQSRAMAAAPTMAELPAAQPAGPLLLAGGHTACPGIGSGPVYRVHDHADLDSLPEGSVLVAREASVLLASVLPRCAALLTEVGSPSGHLAIVSRELGVPAILGVGRALEQLATGDPVTVDATSGRVHAGWTRLPGGRQETPAWLKDSPVVRRLRRVSASICPLNLTDPDSPDFTPEACRSLHDVVRFVHEKLHEVMFQVGNQSGDSAGASERGDLWRLGARLPMEVLLLDAGGGVLPPVSGTPGSAPQIPPEAIQSIPMRWLLEGLLDERIVWDRPRPVSAKGFLSVVGESMVAPPAAGGAISERSYAVLADRYLNFSIRAGYHFSVIDAYFGGVDQGSYVHFRFAGGAADEERRVRRCEFLKSVLSALQFRVRAREDRLTAWLDKAPEVAIRQALVGLGRLTLCSRQLDMLMDGDDAPQLFAGAFLREEFAMF